MHGLYAIADTGVLATADLRVAVAAALAGGAQIVQYRDKGDDAIRRGDQAATIVTLCREAGAVSIINDDVELALSSGADGVHIGRNDADAVAARDRLGPGCLLGVSCYNDLERARAAAAMGADYVAFGSVFASATKPDAVHAPLDLLRRARSQIPLPLCAIGGITADNAAEVFAAGAHMVAVIHDLFEAGDIRARASRIAATER
ncbi:MAG: thiamine phosphate synthase [Halofilum sp. (in: g-proteobacteria)]|nr:thiamine phosphate synthase [Halofilum sp. (in: g-proteobacteria)]